MKATLTILQLLFISIRCCKTHDSTKDIKDILDEIFLDYNPDIRPVKNYSKSVQVNVGIGLQEIIRLDEHLETLTSSHWYTVKWRDEFLTWNKTEYGGIDSITVPGEKIWVPDLFVSNGIELYKSLLLPDNYRVNIRHDGLVTWQVIGLSETHCRMRVGNFPFDTQVCSINLSQWSSYKSEVTLSIDKQRFLMCFFTSSSSWNLNKYRAFEEPICGSITDSQNHQQMLHFELTMSRRPLFYVMSMILPVCLLSVLNPVVFLVSAESGEKMSLSISILLSYFVVLSALSSTLPEVSDSISILNVYVCMMLFLKVITVLSSAAIVSLYHRPKSVPITRIYMYIWTIGNRKGKGCPYSEVNWSNVSKRIDRIMFCIMSVLGLLTSALCFYFLLK